MTTPLTTASTFIPSEQNLLPRTLTSLPNELKESDGDEDWDLELEGSETGNPVEERNPVDLQIELLRTTVNKSNADPKQVRFLYQTTIHICIAHKRMDTVEELFNEIEEGNIFSEFPNLQADLYSRAIQKVIEKGFHDKAYQLYNKAQSHNVWTGFSEQQREALKALEKIGYRFGN